MSVKRQNQQEVIALLRQGWILEECLHPYVSALDDSVEMLTSAFIWSPNYQQIEVLNLNVFKALKRNVKLKEIGRSSRPVWQGELEMKGVEVRYQIAGT